jgi:hypothetical protein
MSPINPTVLALARATIRRAVDRGEPPTDIFPILLGAQRLYASADPDKIIGSHTVTERGTTFRLGARR